MWGPEGLNLFGTSYIIKVGNVIITPKEYILELNKLRMEYNLPENKLKKEALNNLLILAILVYLSQKDGFYVSEEEIKNFIKKLFFKKGKFNLSLFQEYLKSSRLSPEFFKKIVKKWLEAAKYKKAVYSLSYTNNLVLETITLPFLIQLKVKLYNLTYKDINLRITPSEEELKQFYNQLKDKFYTTLPPHVEIFRAKTQEEAKKIIEQLKLEKDLKPFKVIPLNSTVENGTINQLIQKVENSKGISIIKDGSYYLIGVYKPAERKKTSFNEIKSQLVELYKQFKSVEWLHKNMHNLIPQILKGQYKIQPKTREILGYELLEKFKLSPEVLLQILNGKKLISLETSNGIVIIKILSFTKTQNIPQDIKQLYSLQIRKSQYLQKLQEVLDFIFKSDKVKILINKQLINL